MSDKSKTPKTKTWFALVTYGILLYMGLSHFSSISSILVWLFKIVEPVAYGIGIAFVINLIMNIFRRKVFSGMTRSEKPWVKKLCPVCCAVSTALVFALLITLVILFIIPQIISAVNTLIEKLPGSQEQLQTLVLNKLYAWKAPQFLIDKVESIEINWDTAAAFLTKIADGRIESLLGTAFNATTSVVSTAANLLVGLIIAIYILVQKHRVIYIFHKLIELIVPERYRNETFRILHLANKSFASFLTGQITEAIIMGSLSTIGLVIFRFPYAATIGVITGITVLIPIIGAWIGGAFGILLIWVDSPDKVLWFLLFIFVAQQLEGQFIYPKVVGDTIGLPGLLVLIAVILGGGLAGIMGILFAVPLCAILYSLLKEAIDKLPARDPALEARGAADAEAVPGSAAETAAETAGTEAEPVPETVPAAASEPVRKQPPAKRRRRRK